MTMTPLADESALEPPQCCDLEAHLPPREFLTAVDPALIGRCPADPSTVHIAPKRESR
jgi:hypothetical protein